jgi:hypothetical protein
MPLSDHGLYQRLVAGRYRAQYFIIYSNLERKNTLELSKRRMHDTNNQYHEICDSCLVPGMECQPENVIVSRINAINLESPTIYFIYIYIYIYIRGLRLDFLGQST